MTVPDCDSSVTELTVGPDTFRCLDLGEGLPLLFLHGALGDLRTWRRHCDRLAHRRRCLAYTQRYFGSLPWRSDGPPFGTETHASDLEAVCAELALGPVAVVAWSYAGHVALRAAQRRPDLFERMLIYEPGMPTYVTGAEDLEAYSRDAEAMFAPILSAAAAEAPEDLARRLIDASGGRDGTFEGQSAERRTLELDNAHTMPLLLSQEPAALIDCDDLAGLRVPVSIVWGGRSRPTFQVPSRAAARCIGGINHAEIPGAGHLWPDEDPDGFAALIARWLDGGLSDTSLP